LTFINYKFITEHKSQIEKIRFNLEDNV